MRNLRKLRAERGVRQEEVADAIGVSRQQYVTYEKKEYNRFVEEKEEKLCEYFGCNVIELYGEDNFIHKPTNDDEAIFLIKILMKKVNNKDLLKEVWE